MILLAQGATLRDYDSIEYFHRTASTGNVSFNATSNATVLYNAGPANIIGQSFTSSTPADSLLSISIRVSTGAPSGDVTSISVYNNIFGTLVATSTNTQTVSAGQVLTYTFSGIKLGANTPYKFIVNKVSGTGVFALDVNNSNPYSGGVMYNGSTAGSSLSGADLYFTVTGKTGIMASNTVSNSTETYNGGPSNIGQSFTTGTAGVALQTISVRVSPGSNAGDSTTTSLYDAAGNLVSTSTNSQRVTAGATLTYNFPLPILAANTSYKFVINKVSGSDVLFSLDVNNSNPYSGGVMYNGNGASTGGSRQ